MFSLQELITQEVKKSMEKSGIGGDVKFLTNELVIILKKDDLINTIKNAIPDQLRPLVTIEAGDITIKVKVF
jgi:hypothetical protein